jgi:glycerol-3-phosphate acyltransferase PlsY
MIGYRILCVVIGYLFGLFQTGYIYGRLNKVDIREFGSGNAGTTNAMRVLGKKAGIITYIGDMLKALLAGLTVRAIFGLILDCSAQDVFMLVIYAGLGVILGHNYPFYMGFKGGKGIAASSGVVISLFDLRLMLVALFVFAGVLLTSKYVSLASMCMMVTFFAQVVIMNQLGMLKPLSGSKYTIEAYILVFCMAALAVFKHRSNIQRLLNGTERKIGSKKEGKVG